MLPQLKMYIGKRTKEFARQNAHAWNFAITLFAKNSTDSGAILSSPMPHSEK